MVKDAIKPLTGVRGVAAGLVMLFHLVNHEPFVWEYAWIIRRSYLCVDLFFVLSGFLLALRYKPLFMQKFSAINYMYFINLRLKRIYPAFFATLVLYYVFFLLFRATGTTLDDYTSFIVPHFILDAMLLQGWGLGIWSPNGIAWSISSEFLAYLLFPLLIVFTFGRWGVAALAFIATCALVHVAALPFGVDGALNVNWDDSYLTPLRSVADFALGITGYELLSWRRGQKFFVTESYMGGLLLVIAGLILFDTTDVLMVLVFPLLMIGLYHNGKIASRLFGNRYVYYLGLISYSLYLVHPLIFDVMASVREFYRLDNVWLMRVISILLVMGAAHLSYRYIEIPGGRLFERWSSGLARHNGKNKKK